MPKEQKVKRTATQYKNQYSAEKYDRLSVFVPKGRKADIEAYVKTKNGPTASVNRFIGEFFKKQLQMTDDEWKNGKQ